MAVKAFFDTNVLVYAAVGTGKDEPKRKRAMELVESIDFGTSAQVLQEFFVTVAAEALGTDTVYSEDLSHGQRYGRVRIVNPFH